MKTWLSSHIELLTSRPTTVVCVRNIFGGRFAYPLVSGYLTILIIYTDLRSSESEDHEGYTGRYS